MGVVNAKVGFDQGFFEEIQRAIIDTPYIFVEDEVDKSSPYWMYGNFFVVLKCRDTNKILFEINEQYVNKEFITYRFNNDMMHMKCPDEGTLFFDILRRLVFRKEKLNKLLGEL
jgi:hypothetical protein